MDQLTKLQQENIRLRSEVERLECLMRKLVGTVKAMRIAQGDYFRYRGRTFLNKAKTREREVNELIRQHEKQFQPAKPTNETNQLSINL